MIWATRGWDWGFRFLRDGGLDDPLDVYDAVFVGAGDATELLVHRDGYTGLRFPDPAGRTDRSGRSIPHEFVLWAGVVTDLASVEAGRDFVWPLVAREYDATWLSPTPPE